jgi:hypothetical protein
MQVLIKGKARKDLIDEIIQEWHDASPETAKEIAHNLTELMKVQSNPHGTWKGHEAGRVKIRFPQSLWRVFRRIIPDFGDDDSDLFYLADNFPRLFPMNK